jgi:ribosomal protein S27AE
MSIEIYMEESVKKGKCACCGDREWLFRDGDRLICGMCKQDKQLMEQTMEKPDREHDR